MSTLTYESDFSSVVSGARPLPVSKAAAELRARGLEAFNTQGLPTPKQEEWKYFPLRSIADRSWQPGESGPAVFEEDLTWMAEDGLKVVMVNGQLDRNLSDLSAVKGLHCGSLASAYVEFPDLVEPLIGSIADIDNNPFAALNTALFHDGVFIRVEKGAMIEQTIEIVHVSTGDNQVFAPRIFILAEEGCSAKIVERWQTDGSSKSLTIPVVEAKVRERAVIEHIRIQDEALDSCHIGLWESDQAADSEYKAYNIAFGAEQARLDQNMMIGGEHAVARLDGVVCAHKNQIIDNHTKLDHAVPNCNSFEIYKQVIDDKASVVFNGKIFVHLDAQKTDAVQTNQALLLSPDTTINSKPQLEIFADDVKCTHGATVGQIDEDQRFYMMQRGISAEEAEGLLVYAFAAEVLELISIESVKKALEARLYDKLN
jgi:Fe-S cluster assembly protein SufD